MRARKLAGVAMVACAVLAACGDDDVDTGVADTTDVATTGPDDTTQDATATTVDAADDPGGGSTHTAGDGLGRASDYSVLGALAEVPVSATDGSIEIHTGNLVAAGEAAGLERPDSVDDMDELVEWVNSITGGPSDDLHSEPAYVPLAQVFNSQYLLEIDEFHGIMGWSLLDAETFVEQFLPPSRFSAVAGPYDQDTLPDTLVDLGDGVLATGDGEEMAQDPLNRSAVDPLGRSLRLAADGDKVAVAFAADPILHWLDGPESSLADNADLAAIASALDDAGAFSAYLSGGRSYALGAADVVLDADDSEEAQERLTELQGSVLPEPFVAVGIGWSADDDGAMVTIAYQHGTSTAAEVNAEALDGVLTEGNSLTTGRPLSDLYDLVDVATDGSVAIVTLRPGPDGFAGTVFQALAQRDLPLVHA